MDIIPGSGQPENGTEYLLMAWIFIRQDEWLYSTRQQDITGLSCGLVSAIPASAGLPWNGHRPGQRRPS